VSSAPEGFDTWEDYFAADAAAQAELSVLLRGLASFVRRYVVLSDYQADAVALWTAHTHALAAADTTPYLAVTSAEKRSGKTRLLEVLELLVARPWFTGRTTAAALARKVAGLEPTLLLDESDAAFKGDKEYAEVLRGVLNSGYRRGGKTTVCVVRGHDIAYQDLSTFSAKAIAGIGKLPDTVADRSIPLRLERRTREEPVLRFRRREVEAEALALKERVASWVAPVVEALRAARPALPDELDDRAQDVWEPLLAIADLAGASWPTRAREAAVTLSGSEARDDESFRVQLLAAVWRAFNERTTDRLSTRDLLYDLAQDDEAPPPGKSGAWWDDKEKKPGRNAAQKLAWHLRPFGVRSRTVWLPPEETAKGFLLEQFQDAFSRYLPSAPSGPSGPVSEAAGPPRQAAVRPPSRDQEAPGARSVTPSGAVRRAPAPEAEPDGLTPPDGGAGNGVPALGSPELLPWVRDHYRNGYLPHDQMLELVGMQTGALAARVRHELGSPAVRTHKED
jgi:hypothetical protein